MQAGWAVELFVGLLLLQGNVEGGFTHASRPVDRVLPVLRSLFRDPFMVSTGCRGSDGEPAAESGSGFSCSKIATEASIGLLQAASCRGSLPFAPA